MDRRNLLKLGAGGVAAASLAALPAARVDDGKYGRVYVGETPEVHRFHCWLDGQEVTSRCKGANDQEGWADLFTEHWTLKRYYGRVRLERA